MHKVITRYEKLAAVETSRPLHVNDSMYAVVPVISKTPMVMVKAEFLKQVKNSVVNGGMDSRKA